MITVVRSFHDQMSAVVKYEGNLGEEIQVRNGLRQGCVLAPTLFNLYINCVMREWREKVKDTGITFKYDMTKSLVGEYQKRNALDGMVMELQFADDSAFTNRNTRECRGINPKLCLDCCKLWVDGEL